MRGAQPRSGQRVATAIAVGLLGATLGWSTVAVPTASAADISAGSSRYGKGWKTCSPELNGVRTTVGSKQRTVVVVNQKSKTYANTGFYVRINGKACSFQRMFLGTRSRLGYGGTVAGTQRKQGTGTTPRGTYTITSAFGLKADPGSWVAYHRVKSGDYWVQDNKSKYYNTLRNKKAGGFRYWLPGSDKNGSERLTDYPGQYDYSLVINYNRPPNAVRNRGAGIFLHVKGKGATAGCVSISRKNMRTVLAYLRSGDKIVIHS
jgi:L,D-peptidoglycan transpeptidase YkuD (ErfK/YbiS/YcfS/YnhG family)